jgi:starch phosphorylase
VVVLNNEAIDLYRAIDLALWEKLNKNPIRFLQEVNHKKLLEKLPDPSFMAQYNKVVERFDHYMSGNLGTWYQTAYPDRQQEQIVYFSAEYGLHEVLPIYSGGLGVLSGDHCKTASDLGLPFTAVGLFYKQGYFSQRINREGWQETNFSALNISQLPVLPVMTQDQKPLIIHVDMPGRWYMQKYGVLP